MLKLSELSPARLDFDGLMARAGCIAGRVGLYGVCRRSRLAATHRWRRRVSNVWDHVRHLPACSRELPVSSGWSFGTVLTAGLLGLLHVSMVAARKDDAAIAAEKIGRNNSCARGGSALCRGCLSANRI